MTSPVPKKQNKKVQHKVEIQSSGFMLTATVGIEGKNLNVMYWEIRIR